MTCSARCAASFRTCQCGEQTARPDAKSASNQLPCLVRDRQGEGVLHYSIRPAVKALPPLAGPAVERDVPIAAEDDEALLGAIDFVEAGEVRGWACCRGAPGDPVQVSRLCPCGRHLWPWFLEQVFPCGAGSSSCCMLPASAAHPETPCR